MTAFAGASIRKRGEFGLFLVKKNAGVNLLKLTLFVYSFSNSI